jgi:hypothetical protein
MKDIILHWDTHNNTEHSIPLRNINLVKESLSELWANLVNWRAREKSGRDHGEDEKKAGKIENERICHNITLKGLPHKMEQT